MSNATASAPLQANSISAPLTRKSDILTPPTPLPTRESVIGARKTPRKLRKAARAAGTKRAPSHPAHPTLTVANTPSTPSSPAPVTNPHRERLAGSAGRGRGV